MTMAVRGYEKVNGVACVVVSIPVDELFNAPALAPILEQLTAPDVPGEVLQDNPVKKPRKPRRKKAAPAVEAATPIKHTYPDRRKSAATPAAAAPAIVEKPMSANTNEAKMQAHCPRCKPEQFSTYKQWLAAGYKVKSGQHGVRLIGISEVEVNGEKVKKPFFFTKFCACQVEAIAKQVG